MILDLNNPPPLEIDGRPAEELSEEELLQHLTGKLIPDLMEALQSFRGTVAEATQTPIRIDTRETALCASKPYKNALQSENQVQEADGIRSLIVNLEYDRERITRFDLEVQIAIGHLIDLAPEPLIYITPAQIARELLGLTNPKATVPDSFITEIVASMEKLRRLDGALDYRAQMTALHRSKKEIAQAVYKGPLLTYRTLTVGAGGQVVEGYEFSKQLPMFYKHAKDTKQLVFAPRAQLDTTRDNLANLHGMKTRRVTVRFKLLQRYLYREIVRMVKTNTGARGLTYAKIYENAGEPNPTDKVREKMDADIKYCLELWRRQGVIAGYTCKTTGKRVSKITITPVTAAVGGTRNGGALPEKVPEVGELNPQRVPEVGEV